MHAHTHPHTPTHTHKEGRWVSDLDIHYNTFGCAMKIKMRICQVL